MKYLPTMRIWYYKMTRMYMMRTESNVMAVEPRLAATVMLLRDVTAQGQGRRGIEVFMVRRAVQSEFLPDLYVFPGGSVAADDRSVEQTEGLCMPVRPSLADPEGRTSLGNGVRTAAIRELFEEANVLLAYRDNAILAIYEEQIVRFASYRQALNERKGSLLEMARTEHLTFATDRLTYFAHWITPEGLPKRYDTHFFLATAPAEQEALYDQLETSDGVWIQPPEAMTRFQGGDFPVAFPTFHLLRALANFDRVQDVLAAAATRYVTVQIPRLIEQDGKREVYLPNDPDYHWKV
jgi:8-oxo-dGTP pyrophosphatase MutT (NUDIX family)